MDLNFLCLCLQLSEYGSTLSPSLPPQRWIKVFVSYLSGGQERVRSDFLRFSILAFLTVTPCGLLLETWSIIVASWYWEQTPLIFRKKLFVFCPPNPFVLPFYLDPAVHLHQYMVKQFLPGYSRKFWMCEVSSRQHGFSGTVGFLPLLPALTNCSSLFQP